MSVIPEEIASGLEVLGWEGVYAIDEELTKLEQRSHALRVLRARIVASLQDECRKKVLENLAAASAAHDFSAV